MKKITFFFALFFLALPVFQMQGVGFDLQSDSLALVSLYEACADENHTGLENWLSAPLSEWQNVTITEVDGVNRVTGIAFKNMALVGTLPDALGNLSEMSGKIELLDQAGLTGTFPAAIWNWTKVERMQIKRCGFTAMDVDGLENMINLYEINTEETPFEGEVPLAFFTLPAMRDIYLEDGMWSSLPDGLTLPTPTPIRRFYLNGNQFTDLPDLSGMVWASGAKIKISNNALTFEDVEPNMWIATDANVDAFEYSPQQESIGDDVYVYAAAGSEVILQSNIEASSSTVYVWIKADEQVGDTENLTLDSFDPATQSGTYYCIVQNSAVPGLEFKTGMSMVYENVTAQDSLALVALYNECGGENGSGYDNWLEGPLSTWQNVTVSEVDGVDRVTHVEFKYMTVTGALPSVLGNLTEMSGKIQLHNKTELTGEFPAFIWNWTKVEILQIKYCGYSSIDVTGIEKMVNLTEFNTQGTPFEGEIPAELFQLPMLAKLYLHECKWSSLPAEMPLPTATSLTRLYLNDNELVDLPDLTGMSLGSGAKVSLQNNYFSFEDLAPNMWIADVEGIGGFTYSPQNIDAEDKFVYVASGSEVTLESNIGGTPTTIYSWIKGEEEITDTEDLSIDAFNPSTQSGAYFCIVQDPSVAGLVITTPTTSLFSSATAMDSLVLRAFYDACVDTSATGVANWTTAPFAEWTNVTFTTVDTVQRVSNIGFKNMVLSGTLPDALANLTEMSGKIEMLDQPGLTGTFPASIWNWTKVERMQIKRCGFTSIDVTGIEKMVNLYEINTESTPFEGEIPAAIFNLPLMRDVYLEDGMWTALPADMPMPTPTDLRRLYVNGNQITDLPDFTAIYWAEGAKVKLQNNALTFEDLEPNMWVANDANLDAFEYSPQALLTEKDTLNINLGDAFELGVSCGGTENIYIWTKDGELIDGADSDTLIIASSQVDDSGLYKCIVQNTLVPGLDITSDTFTVVVSDPSNLRTANESVLQINSNPVQNVLSIDSKDVIESVSITDITGKQVRSVRVNNVNLRMDVSDLVNGIYIVSLKGKTTDSVVRIIKK